MAYAKLEPGAPIGLDGKVVDTPEVAYAKAEHAAAHLNERLRHASAPSDAVVIESAKLQPSGGAPIGLDGRVVDTPEVAFAKAEHAAAHLNEKLRTSSPVLAAPVVAAPAAVAYEARAIAAPALASTIVSPLPVLTKAQPGEIGRAHV